MRNALSFIAAACLLTAHDPVGAATFTVSKIADTNDGVCDADCSLREAMAAATASPEDDTIVFDAAVFNTPQTITLSGTEIVINANGSLVIEGPGADLLTIDGNDASRIIGNNGAVSSIRNLRFTGGNGVGAANSGRGGAIYNNGGTMMLERVVIEGNNAANGGGVNNASAGTLAILDSLFSGNSSSGSGGSLQNFSTSVITVLGCTFVGNTSNGITGGGAAQLNGDVVIANSTFSDNAAPAGSGGAISANAFSILVVNSTFAGNSALDNAGGLHRSVASTSIFLRNSIFSGNSSTNGASPDVTASNAVTSLGNNAVGVAGPTLGWIGSDLLDQDPLLGALADNGGPTPTFRLLENSPAIDAAQNCVIDQSCASNNLIFNLDFDQRGMPRPAGGLSDIGSYETQIELSTPIFADGFEGP